MKIKVKNLKSGVVEFHTEKKAKFLARFKNIEVFWPKKVEPKKAVEVKKESSKNEEVIELVSKKTKKSAGKSTADK